MKTFKALILSTACIFAIGAALATTTFTVATQAYKVNPTTGQALIPLQPVDANSFCVSDNPWCHRVYQLDASGNPTGTGTPVRGTYTIDD